LPEPKNAALVERTAERDMVRLCVEYNRLLSETKTRERDLAAKEGELQVLQGMKPVAKSQLPRRRDDLQRRLEDTRAGYELAILERSQLQLMAERTQREIRLDSADVKALREEIMLASRAKHRVCVRAGAARDADVATRGDLACAREDLRRFEQRASAQVEAIQAHMEAEENHVDAYEARIVARAHMREQVRHSREYQLRAKHALNLVLGEVAAADKEEGRGEITKIKEAFSVFFEITGTNDLTEMVRSLSQKTVDTKRMHAEVRQKEERIEALRESVEAAREELQRVQYGERRSTSSKKFEAFASRLDTSTRRMQALVERDAATDRMLKLVMAMVGQFNDQLSQRLPPGGVGAAGVGTPAPGAHAGGSAGLAANFFGRGGRGIEDGINALDVSAPEATAEAPPSARREVTLMAPPGAAEHAAAMDAAAARGRAAASAVVGRVLGVCERGDSAVRSALGATEQRLTSLLMAAAPPPVSGTANISVTGRRESVITGSDIRPVIADAAAQGGAQGGSQNASADNGTTTPSARGFSDPGAVRGDLMGEAMRTELGEALGALEIASDLVTANNDRVTRDVCLSSALEGPVADFIFAHRDELHELARVQYGAAWGAALRASSPYYKATVGAEQLDGWLRELDGAKGALRAITLADVRGYCDAVLQMHADIRWPGSAPQKQLRLTLNRLLQEPDDEEGDGDFASAADRQRLDNEHVATADVLKERTLRLTRKNARQVETN